MTSRAMSDAPPLEDVKGNANYDANVECNLLQPVALTGGRRVIPACAAG